LIQIKAESLKDNPDYCQCPRCWKFHHVFENFDSLCDRCINVILDDFPNHESVPFIKVALEKQRKKYTVQS